MEAINVFFKETLKFEHIILFIAGVMLVAAAICAVVMATGSNLARVRGTHKRMAKYFNTHAVLNDTNAVEFYRKVIKFLPDKARKQWRDSKSFYGDFCSQGFKNALTHSVNKGGNRVFVAYLGVYLIAIVGLIVLAMLQYVRSAHNIALFSFCIVIGGGALLALALQLYFMDKHASTKANGILTFIQSRVIVPQAQQEYKAEKLNSADKAELNEFHIYNATDAVTINDENIEVVEEAKPVEEMTFAQAFEAITKGNVQCIANAMAEDFDELHKTQKFEEKLNNAQKIGTKCDMADRLSELEYLVNDIIADGANDELLQEIYAALSDIANCDYAKPIDNIRIKCLIRRLEVAL